MVINMHIYQEENKIIIAEGKSQVWIEAWGANSLRVRMTALPKMDENDWALTEKVEPVKPRIIFETIDVTDPWYQGEEYAKYHLQSKGRAVDAGILENERPHQPLLCASSYHRKRVKADHGNQ